MATAAARAWAGAASRGADRPPSRGTGRPRRLRFVTPLLWVVMALSATAAPDAAAEEPAASSSSMLRRRQVDESAAVAAGGAGATEAPVATNGAVAEEAPVLGMEAVDLDDLDLWGQGQAAAFEEGGDKGWFTGGGGGPQWPKCAWAGTLTRNISNIFAL